LGLTQWGTNFKKSDGGQTRRHPTWALIGDREWKNAKKKGAGVPVERQKSPGK